ncbi:MAG: hypothetical protein PHW13_13225 [Methylococcales bacterium]|nr:hypothetical protein [Methylococcales bacterium]
MNKCYSIASVVLLALNFETAHAYGGDHSSGSSCKKPVFSQFQPAVNKYLQSFTEFSFIASENTIPTSIVVNVSFGEHKFHFTAKELVIKPLKNGHLAVKGKMERPLEHGFARVSMTAHSKPGCEHSEGYLVRIY